MNYKEFHELHRWLLEDLPSVEHILNEARVSNNHYVPIVNVTYTDENVERRKIRDMWNLKFSDEIYD